MHTLTPEEKLFIQENANADIRQLALKKLPDFDMPFVLDQIAGRQMARKKLPAWAAIDGIVYPPHISMEQCSSETTARYKAAVARRLTDGKRLVDITGGFGVDFAFMAERFDCGVYVERQQRLCSIAHENFCLLGLNAETVCADGTEYLKSMPHASLLFADPARRDTHGARTFGITDCTPDVLALRDTMLDKADCVMLKLSPMLDWRKAVADMGRNVGEVHIVAVGGECKDLLLVMSRRYDGLRRIYCVNDDSVFDYAPDEATVADTFRKPASGLYLYEPNASLMKAGCFALVAQRFGMAQVGRDSHLLVNDEAVKDFPGRRFRIERTTTMNKRELKAALADVGMANIAVRNFPMTVAELRKRLKIADGGDAYIFATTLADRAHALLLCSKI